MINAELERAFERIADLLEIDGTDGFRVNSYRRAARAISDATDDIAVLAREDRLKDLPGIGKSTAEKIAQFIKTGTIDLLTELEAKFPKGLPDLLEIQGLGPKKVALAYRELSVGGMDDLKRVIASGQLAKLKGMGAASVQKIADGIAFLESSGQRTMMGIALPIAEEWVERVRKLPGVKQVSIGGSLRRGAETVGDIDILCDAPDGAAVVSKFVAFDGVRRVLASGDTKGSVTVTADGGHEIQVDLRVVPKESFGAALQYFTGSKAHNVRLREMAVKRKLKLNEYGLFDGDKQLAGAKEEDIYKYFGLPCYPPELREDRGEFDITDAKAFEKLVTVEDIRGDLHMHTTASDGVNTLDEMAAAAKARGYEFIAICDHSKSSTIANGLTIERMEQQIKDIHAARQRIKGIDILVGCECDILPDGSMDYPDDLLAQCDWVMASIHSAQGKGGSHKLSPTERTLAAIENRWVSCIGHPTGRLINKRPPMDLDMAAVVAAAAKNHTMLEINASRQRLDLKDLHIRQALAAGVTLTINTDAHRSDDFAKIRYGVLTARRGFALVKDIANCLTPAALRKRIAKKRDLP